MTRQFAERASDRAYRELRQAVLELELQPGDVIAEVETAKRLGVSRTPLREALTRLLADGLLVQIGARGLAVAPLSASDVTNLMELREALEAQSVRLAATRGDSRVFASLATRFGELATAGITEGSTGPERSSGDSPAKESPSEDLQNAGTDMTYELAAELDSAIDEAAANPVLTAAIEQVRLRLVRMRRLAKDHPARLAEAAGEHRTIAEAIAWGDPELAQSALRLHLRRSLNHALARLAEHDLERQNTDYRKEPA